MRVHRDVKLPPQSTVQLCLQLSQSAPATATAFKGYDAPLRDYMQPLSTFVQYGRQHEDSSRCRQQHQCRVQSRHDASATCNSGREMPDASCRKRPRHTACLCGRCGVLQCAVCHQKQQGTEYSARNASPPATPHRWGIWHSSLGLQRCNAPACGLDRVVLVGHSLQQTYLSSWCADTVLCNSMFCCN